MICQVFLTAVDYDTLEILHEALYEHYMGEVKKASVDYITLDDIYPEWLEYTRGTWP